MIANDCYKTGQFYYAAKAFDVLERLDPNPEFWDGKRGACIGWFQRVIAEKEPKGLADRSHRVQTIIFLEGNRAEFGISYPLTTKYPKLYSII